MPKSPSTTLALTLLSTALLSAQTSPRDTLPPDSLATLLQGDLTTVPRSRASYAPYRPNRIARAEFNSGNIYDSRELLTGTFPGLIVSTPGYAPAANATVRLRANTTLYGDAAPLFVVDGFAGVDPRYVEDADVTGFNVAAAGQGGSRFGQRGGGGVIYLHSGIDRWRNVKSGWNYRGGVSAAVPRLPTVLDAADHRAEVRAAVSERGGGGLTPEQAVDRISFGADTDWLDELTRTGLSHQHHLSRTHTMKNGAYRLGLAYRGVQGIGSDHDGFRRLNGTISGYRTFLKKNQLRLSGRLTYFDETADVLPPAAFFYAQSYNPSAPVRVDDPGANVPEDIRQRSLAQSGGYFQENVFSFFNPVAIRDLNRQQRKENALLGQLRGRLRISDRVWTMVAYHRLHQDESFLTYAQRTDPFRGNAFAADDRRGLVSSRTGNLTNQQFNWNGSLRLKHRGTDFGQLYVGYVHQRFARTFSDRSGIGVDENDITFDDVDRLLDAATLTLNPAGTTTTLEQLSAFTAALQTRWMGLLNLTGRLRYEGSSRNGPDARWHLYGGAAASVDLAEVLLYAPERDLNLRLAYERSGNQPFGVADHRGVYRNTDSGELAFGDGSFRPGFELVNAPNTELRPEIITTVNLGIDYTSADQRLKGALDVYRSRTTDVLLPTPAFYQSSAFTVAPQAANVADLEIRSGGLELSVEYRMASGYAEDHFSLGFQLATYRSDLETREAAVGEFRWGLEQEQIRVTTTGATGGCCVPLSHLLPGEAVGALYGPRIDLPASRRDQRVVLTNDGEPQFLGSGLPTLSLGAVQSFRKGRVSGRALVTGVFGHSLYNLTNALLARRDALTTRPVENLLVNDRTVQEIYLRPDGTDLLVEKGNYVSLSNLSFGYDFAQKDKKKFRGTVFVAGQNLVLLTDYSGNDPSVRFFPDLDHDGSMTGRERVPAIGLDQTTTPFRAATAVLGVTVGW